MRCEVRHEFAVAAGTEFGQSPRGGSAHVHVSTYADAGGLATSWARDRGFAGHGRGRGRFDRGSEPVRRRAGQVAGAIPRLWREHCGRRKRWGGLAGGCLANGRNYARWTGACRSIRIRGGPYGRGSVGGGFRDRLSASADPRQVVVGDRLAKRARGGARGSARASGFESPRKALCAELRGTYQTVASDRNSRHRRG